MMTKTRRHLSKMQFLSCLLVVFFLLHPLGVFANQAVEDEGNKSVLDGYDKKDGQASDEQTPVEPEDNGLAEPSTVQENELDGLMEDQSLFGMFIQLFLALAVIILMIYALIRFIGKRSQSYQANRTLQNIGGVHIGTNRSIQLVRVGDRVLVVGVGESIQLLKEIDNSEEVTTILKDYQMQEAPQQLSSIFNKLQITFSELKGKKPDKAKVNFKSLLDRQLIDVKKSQKEAHAAIKEKEQQ